MSSSAPPASENKPGVSPRVVAALVLIVVVIVFAAINTQQVRIHWAVTTTRAPMVVVIVVSGLIGAAIGAIARHRHGRQPAGTQD